LFRPTFRPRGRTGGQRPTEAAIAYNCSNDRTSSSGKPESNFHNQRDNLRQSFFFIGLLVALLLGFTNWIGLAPFATNTFVRGGLVAAILFLTAVTIDLDEFQSVLRNPFGVGVAFAISFCLIPLIAWLIGRLVDADTRLAILVMAAAPATMSSATVWTARANGNQALSLAISMLSNSLCFLITPLCLAWLAELPPGTSLRIPTLMGSLLFLVILPITTAQVVRRHRLVPLLCRRYAGSISMTVQLGVLIMALFGATVTGIRMRDGDTSPTLITVVGVILAVIALRGLGLSCGFGVTRLLGLPPRDQVAIAIAGSQKTLVVGLQVGIDLGCSILPIVGYHIAQLTIDSVFASRFRMAHSQTKDG